MHEIKTNNQIPFFLKIKYLEECNSKSMKNIDTKQCNIISLPYFGERLNDKRNSYRRSPPRRGEGCSIKKQSIRRV